MRPRFLGLQLLEIVVGVVASTDLALQSYRALYRPPRVQRNDSSVVTLLAHKVDAECPRVQKYTVTCAFLDPQATHGQTRPPALDLCRYFSIGFGLDYSRAGVALHDNICRFM